MSTKARLDFPDFPYFKKIVIIGSTISLTLVNNQLSNCSQNCDILCTIILSAETKIVCENQELQVLYSKGHSLMSIIRIRIV